MAEETTQKTIILVERKSILARAILLFSKNKIISCKYLRRKLGSGSYSRFSRKINDSFFKECNILNTVGGIDEINSRPIKIIKMNLNSDVDEGEGFVRVRK